MSKSSFVFCLTLLGASVLMQVSAGEKPHESGVLHRELRAIVQLRSILGKTYAEVVLHNDTDEFMCVSANAFTTQRGHIQFMDKNGTVIPPDRVTDKWPQKTLGFDFMDSYLILQPKEKRSISIDDAPAALSTTGEYGYEITFPYYNCREVVDRARLRASKNVAEFVAHSAGKLSVE